jgi:peptide/nickel transport system permease protein
MTTAGPWRDPLSRALHKTSVRIALGVLAAFVIVAILAPVIAPHDPVAVIDAVKLKDQPPSLAFPLGTDPSGRDVLSRLMFGARISLAVSVFSVLVAMSIGTALGAITGYFGGVVDTLVMRVIDALLSVPRVLLLFAVASLWGKLGVPALIVILGLTGWFGLTRLVRAEVLEVKERDFVLAARALGTSHARILVRHVLPHALTSVTVASALGVASAIMVEAGMSFLGIGVAQPTPSWGNMIQDGASAPHTHWWVSLFPGLALAITVIAVNVVADGLREALSPRQLPAR